MGFSQINLPLSARANNMGFSSLICVPSVFLSVSEHENEAWKSPYYLRAQIKAVYLRETHISAPADNMGFSQINRVFVKKPTLSADNVGFFQKNLLYLRETHII